MSVHLAVSTAIIESDRVVLIQREDFRVWGLPGGDVDPGESLAQAAVRESLEETGLTVEITRLVGMYSLVGDAHSTISAVLAARLVAGAFAPDPHEISDIGWFSPDAMPSELMWWHRQRIIDAFAGVAGVVWRQEGGWPFPPGFTRRDLYAARDASGLPRAEAFRQLFPDPGQQAQVLEAPGVVPD